MNSFDPTCSKCGASYNAGAQFCSRCGQSVSSGINVGGIQTEQINIQIGKVEGTTGAISFSIMSTPDGQDRMAIYAWDPGNSRKSGIVLFVNDADLARIADLASKTAQAGQEIKRRRHGQ